MGSWPLYSILDLDTPAFFGASFGGTDDGNGPIGVFQAGRVANQAGHRAVELGQKLFADGPLAFERLQMPPRFVEPDHRGRQIDEGDALLAADLQGRRGTTELLIEQFGKKRSVDDLDAAPVQLRAMVLLGINCGLNNKDWADLPLAALDLEQGWVNFLDRKLASSGAAPRTRFSVASCHLSMSPKSAKLCRPR